MKKIAFYTAILALPVLFLSCSITKRMADRAPLHTTPDSLPLFVNQQTDPYTVNIAYTLQVPPRYVPRKAQVVYESYLVNGDHRQTVSKTYLDGRTYRKLMWRQQKFERRAAAPSDGTTVLSGREPLSLETNTTVVFEEWMPNAVLEASTSVKLCGREYPLGKQVLTRGMIYIPEGPGPVIINESMPIIQIISEPVIRKAEGSASLSYPVNGYRIDASFGNNSTELERMTSLLNKILKDTLYKTERIVVTGICSPDGSYAYNQDLARNRAGTVKDYLVKQLGVNPDLIQTDYIAEDWDGLRRLVELSDLPDKTAALAIIDGTNGPDAKEAALRNLPSYQTIRTKMYPVLRRVKYEIFYTEKIMPQ